MAWPGPPPAKWSTLRLIYLSVSSPTLRVARRIQDHLTDMAEISDLGTSLVPFPRDSELCSSLNLASDTASIIHGKESTANSIFKVPGEPWLDFDIVSLPLQTFLTTELLTPSLDKLSPYLWLVSTPRSDHISALHQQLIKGRQITVAENPELHLTWIHNHVYIKPLPECLLSWEFWRQCLTPVNGTPVLPNDQCALARASALGFIRSYSYLILHASDYRIARECGLIPRYTTYAALRRFLSHFRDVADTEVSSRYHFGELRLRRVNFWARFFLRRFLFQKVQVHYNYNAYFSRFYGPLIFVFAFFSTTLSAMQVELAANTSPPGLSEGFQMFIRVSKWYSVCTVLVASGLLAGLILLLIYMALREFVFAVRFMLRKRWGSGTKVGKSGGA
jgi:hypothetical protein